MSIFYTILLSICLYLNVGFAQDLKTPASFESKANTLQGLQVISKLSNKKAAEDLARSLIKSGQNVRIIPVSEKIKLKSISIGLFPNQEKANNVVEHLKSNGIEAFPYRVKSGKYRVHAGAMQQEIHYWNRFEQLLTLGYKRINTKLKTAAVTHFFIVRERIENIQPPLPTIQTNPVIAAKKKVSLFETRFLFGRFKGEFSSWKNESKQSSSNYFNAALSAQTTYKKQWDFIYGIRFEALEQSSINNLQYFELQWLPTYLQVQEPHNRMQFGLIDGRWDNRKNTSLSDRLSSKIFSRYLLDDDVVDRRQPIYGARWQFLQANYELNIIATPIFRPAKLPLAESIWHPINRSNNTLIGIKPTSIGRYLIANGSFASEKLQFGGIGIRMSHKIGNRTRSTTIQYAPRSAPYYELNPDIQRLLYAGSTAEDALAAIKKKTFTPRHPHSAIFSWEEYGKVSHFEVAALTNTPYTTTAYQMKKALSFEWKIGFIYPTKDKNIHISSYFIGRRLNTQDDMLDRNTKLGLKGKVFKQTQSKRWKAGFNYQIDLDHFGLFLNPQIKYEQNKYLRVSLYYQLFAGNQMTDNGFYKNYSRLGLNWQAIF